MSSELPQTWEKKGLVFRPDPSLPWMRSHACAPVPVWIEDELVRVFFASRDDRNRSHVGYFDLRLDEYSVVDMSLEPVLAPGPWGHFDDHGIYASSVVRDGGRLLMYTIGWSPGSPPPLFYASIGLAISEDGGRSFKRVSRAPVMARSEYDPCAVTGPMVIREGERFRMWYVSGYRWEEIDGNLHSNYNIKYAESTDGVHWKRTGAVAIAHASPEEKNIGRPFVTKDGQCYRAWYGYNVGRGYRMGYAESTDGARFSRKDHLAGLEPSENGHDSEMLAHPQIIRHRNRELMFYNGNGFGRDGVLLAIRQIE